MAVNYTPQKLNMVSRVSDISVQIGDLVAEALQLRQEAIDNAFRPGETNGTTDTELNGGTNPPFPHLAVADVTAAFAAILALDTALAANTRTHYKALERMKV